MACAYLYLTCDIISNTEDLSNQIDPWDKILSHGESIMTILIDLLVAIVGVYSIWYLYKLKEKRLNATFSFYSRLGIRLHVLKSLLEDYQEAFLDRYIPQAHRHELPLDSAKTINDSIDKLLETANETLLFLKAAEEQVPASPNWIECYNILLDFLYDCGQLENEMYFKWRENYKEKQSSYYKKHHKNIETMLEDILSSQKILQAKLYKKPKQHSKKTRQ